MQAAGRSRQARRKTTADRLKSLSSFPALRRCEKNQPLRLLETGAGRRRDAPMVETAGGPAPSVGCPDLIALVDLLDFGCVLDNHAAGTDEVVERVVSRPVPSRPPFDGIAGIFQ